MAVAISAIGFFIPIFAFLFVFIVVYAILKKTEILGSNDFVMLLVSFILASFFIVQASLIEFVRFTSAWFSVGIIALFFLLAIIGFIPGEVPKDFNVKVPAAIALIVLMIIFFVISAGYVFDLAINFGAAKGFLDNDWVGMVLLLAIAGVVAWKMKKD